MEFPSACCVSPRLFLSHDLGVLYYSSLLDVTAFLFHHVLILSSHVLLPVFAQALAVLPTSGNPHNQLAVLATYTDAECVSVYRYCRSLMIESPFQTAHENLTLLFEKNKQKGFGLSLAAGGTEVKDPSAVSSRDLGSSGSGMPTQHHGKGKGKGSGG